VQVHRLALLPAQGQHGSGSSGGGGLLSAARSGTFGRAGGGSAPAKTFSKTRLKRSTHVRSAGELVVEVWWVQQPSLGNLGEHCCCSLCMDAAATSSSSNTGLHVQVVQGNTWPSLGTTYAVQQQLDTVT
jgi:hypothetical protein